MEAERFAGAGIVVVLATCCAFGSATERTIETKRGVTARVVRRTFKTYPYSDPDPVPATGEKRYPYHRHDGTTAQAISQEWLTVEIESDRLRLTFLPEIGGKLWGAVDKKTGRDFIYYNPVIKFRNIGMCGPWTNGGIEFNFGIIGHAPTTATPVRWRLRENEDGSVSYFCGDSEKICGTVWQVETRLDAGQDFFTTRTLWNNDSGLPEPYYHWKNAGFSMADDPELVFAGATQVGHEGDAHPWPRDEKERYLAKISENAFGSNKSYHIVSGDPRYYAIWWNGQGLGAYHQCDYGVTYGRKIWLWALSREGKIWDGLLTDDGRNDMELQAGRAFNQPRRKTFQTPFKHPTFSPGRTDMFEETWGVARSRGDVMRHWNEADAVSRPVVAPKDFDWESAYGHFVRGQQALRERDDRVAADSLAKSLAKEPTFLPALVLSSELAVRRGQYSMARDFAARALAIDTYEPAANYLDGLAAEALGDVPTALERLGLAAYSSEYRVAARCEMARIYRMSGDETKAAKCIDDALTNDPRSIAALKLKGDFQTLEKLWPTYAERNDGEFLMALARAFARKDVAALAELATRSTAFVFPYSRDHLAALDWAIESNDSWKFKYLRALLAAYFADEAKADALLSDCDGADDPAVFLYRANRRKGAARLADLKRAQALGDSWRVGAALADHFAQVNDYKAVLATTENYLKRFPKSNPIEIRQAKALNALGEYRRCVDFLMDVAILPSEFGDNAVDVWQEAWRKLGDDKMAETYPEHLGAGKPFPKGAE